MKHLTLALAIVAPMAAVAVVGIVFDLADQLSPCVVWQVEGFAPNLPPSARCAEGKVRGETRAGNLLRLAAVQGLILFAAGVAVWGASRRRPWPVFLAAGIMLLEVFPTALSIWPIALLTAIGLLVVANLVLQAAKRTAMK